jgi:hypothetical protein
LSDDNLAALAHMRDGRWSAQTKALLKRFGTGKLDLNSGWASTWTLWSCPCCRREKAQIARLSGSGVLLCRLEFHHDHLADFAKRIFSEHNQRSEDQETNIQIGRAKDALMLFVERFERTLICIDCNLAEGRAKLELAKEIDSNFTFSPSQIAMASGARHHRLRIRQIKRHRSGRRRCAGGLAFGRSRALGRVGRVYALGVESVNIRHQSDSADQNALERV